MPLEYLRALGGGVLIGTASILLLLADGRIAGISGMIGGLMRERTRRDGLRRRLGTERVLSRSGGRGARRGRRRLRMTRRGAT